MAAIDLSKAKIGDKFRTKGGLILEYIGESSYRINDKYILEVKRCVRFYFYKYGNYMAAGEHRLDLVEQVFNETLDTIERDERRSREMQKFVEDEENQELQRRQEVVELADRIFFSERGSAYSFKDCIEVAEHSVNMIKQYLKEGKL